MSLSFENLLLPVFVPCSIIENAPQYYSNFGRKLQLWFNLFSFVYPATRMMAQRETVLCSNAGLASVTAWPSPSRSKRRSWFERRTAGDPEHGIVVTMWPANFTYYSCYCITLESALQTASFFFLVCNAIVDERYGYLLYLFLT
jgi:hypothetical protein